MKPQEPVELDLAAVMASASENIRRAFENMQATVEKMRRGRTPLQIDAASAFRYELAVNRERAVGQKFVKDYAAKVRKDMGL